MNWTALQSHHGCEPYQVWFDERPTQRQMTDQGVIPSTVRKMTKEEKENEQRSGALP